MVCIGLKKFWFTTTKSLLENWFIIELSFKNNLVFIERYDVAHQCEENCNSSNPSHSILSINKDNSLNVQIFEMSLECEIDKYKNVASFVYMLVNS